VTPTQLLVLAIIAVPLMFALTDRLRSDVAALLIALMLGGAQLLGLGVLSTPDTPRDASRALAGLSQPVVMTLFGLFIVSQTLEKFGVASWIAQRLLRIGGQSEPRLIVLLTSATAVLSLFMNNLAAGALLLPTALDISRQARIPPSRLLIPVSFGSLLGGIATYFTTANIIASDLLLAANPPQTPLGILDFTAVGGLMALAGIAYMGLIGRHLLPMKDATPDDEVPEVNRELAYGLERRFWELILPPATPFAGLTLREVGLPAWHVLSVRQRRDTLHHLTTSHTLGSGDVLTLATDEARARRLAAQSGGALRRLATPELEALGLLVVEVLPTPDMGAIGRSLDDLELRLSTGFVPLAMLRDGKPHDGDLPTVRLRMGDALLMVGPDAGKKRLDKRRDLLLLRQVKHAGITRPYRALFTVGVTGLAVGASVLGVPVFLAMLGAALAIILTKTLTMEEAYAGMEWNAIFLIAGMYAASQAMVNTGAAALIGEQVVRWVEPLGGLGLVGGAYLLSAVLTQVIGGQVTAFVTAPITISAAITLGVNPQAVAIATAMGCSASFITPISHAVNVLVMGPGGYAMRDFARVGAGLLAVCFVMLLVGMRVFWGV
jgi:di/tricarboxylate transporter